MPFNGFYFSHSHALLGHGKVGVFSMSSLGCRYRCPKQKVRVLRQSSNMSFDVLVREEAPRAGQAELSLTSLEDADARSMESPKCTTALTGE